jgi:ABC-type uncharacterized transport system substrate-binding protein
LAADLVNRKVDLIVTFGGTTAARAAKSATSEIPIIFAFVGDPVQVGLVASLDRTLPTFELTLLKRPDIRRNYSHVMYRFW